MMIYLVGLRGSGVSKEIGGDLCATLERRHPVTAAGGRRDPQPERARKNIRDHRMTVFVVVVQRPQEGGAEFIRESYSLFGFQQ